MTFRPAAAAAAAVSAFAAPVAAAAVFATVAIRNKLTHVSRMTLYAWSGMHDFRSTVEVTLVEAYRLFCAKLKSSCAASSRRAVTSQSTAQMKPTLIPDSIPEGSTLIHALLSGRNFKPVWRVPFVEKKTFAVHLLLENTCPSKHLKSEHSTETCLLRGDMFNTSHTRREDSRMAPVDVITESGDEKQ